MTTAREIAHKYTLTCRCGIGKCVKHNKLCDELTMAIEEFGRAQHREGYDLCYELGRD